MIIPRAIAGIFLVSLTLNPQPASADLIRLRNGLVYEGEITKETETEVTIGTARVLRHEIGVLEYSKPMQIESGRYGRHASVTLKNGEIVRGKLERGTQSHVVLVMPIGRQTLPRSSITLIEYGPAFPGVIDELSLVTGPGSLEAQLDVMRLEGRQSTDRFALASIWMVTLLGDVLGDGTLHPGAIFPVAGPFAAASRVDGKGSKAMYIFSGLAQTLCALDLVNSSVMISRTKRRVYLSLRPEHGGMALSCKF